MEEAQLEEGRRVEGSGGSGGRLERRRGVRGVRAAGGCRGGNGDATVMGEGPRLGEHLPRMGEALAQCLGGEASAVNLKATTNEGLGAIAAGAALAALAVALLQEDVP